MGIVARKRDAGTDAGTDSGTDSSWIFPDEPHKNWPYLFWNDVEGDKVIKALFPAMKTALKLKSELCPSEDSTNASKLAQIAFRSSDKWLGQYIEISSECINVDKVFSTFDAESKERERALSTSEDGLRQKLHYEPYWRWVIGSLTLDFLDNLNL